MENDDMFMTLRPRDGVGIIGINRTQIACVGQDSTGKAWVGFDSPWTALRPGEQRDEAGLLRVEESIGEVNDEWCGTPWPDINAPAMIDFPYRSMQDRQMRVNPLKVCCVRSLSNHGVDQTALVFANQEPSFVAGTVGAVVERLNKAARGERTEHEPEAESGMAYPIHTQQPL